MPQMAICIVKMQETTRYAPDIMMKDEWSLNLVQGLEGATARGRAVT